MAGRARHLERQAIDGCTGARSGGAYPQLVLVWHEIVNDRFPSGLLSVTYCPLTGSVVGFRAMSRDGKPSTFGTSGSLVNSNLLMYDRQSDSRWPQILGQAISGAAKGQVLEEFPLEWTTWGAWRKLHPDTTVLSTETGHIRRYGDDPYGSYRPVGGYSSSDDLFFPVMRTDRRLPPLSGPAPRRSFDVMWFAWAAFFPET